jgi:sporulation protein YlmC with PRC-barrel domain
MIRLLYSLSIATLLGIGACPAMGQSSADQTRADQQASENQEEQALRTFDLNGDYGDLYEDGWSAENLLGGTVHGPQGDDIGTVHNLLLNRDSEIVALIAEIGGFLEIGDTHVAVPWDEVEVLDYEEVVIPVTAENVEDYPATADEYFTRTDVGRLQTLEEDLETGPRVWKATNLLDENVVLEDGAAYGYVIDLIFDGDVLRSVVVSAANPEIGYGRHAYPFHGVGPGYWEPGLGYFTVPYRIEEISELENVELVAPDSDE